MLFYTAVYSFLIFILMIASFSDEKYKSSLYFIFFFTIFVMAGLRGDVGQDTFSYQSHYNSLISFENFLVIVSKKEPFLYFLMYPHKMIFDNYTGFLLLVSFFQTGLLCYATRNMYHRSTFLAIYLFAFLFEYHFNLLRASFAMLFFLCSLSVIHENRSKAAFFYFLALMSHVTALVLLPIIFLRFKFTLKKSIYFVSIVLFILFFVFYFFGDVIAYKIVAYDLLSVSGFQVPKAVVIILIFSGVLLLSNKSISLAAFASFVLFSMAFFWSSVSDIAYRIYMIVFASMIFFMFEKRAYNFKTLRFQPYVVAVFGLSLWFGGSVWYRASLEQEQRVESGVGRPDFSFAPYSFYFDSKYRGR